MGRGWCVVVVGGRWALALIFCFLVFWSLVAAAFVSVWVPALGFGWRPSGHVDDLSCVPVVFGCVCV